MEDWEKQLRKRKKFNDLIINRPEALTNLRRRTEISITTIGWIIWIFICRPILLLMLWAVGFRFFFEHMVSLGGLTGLLQLWPIYASVIVCIFLAIRGWNVYNRSRFGNGKVDRRKAAPPVSAQELEQFFKMPGSAAARLQSAAEILVEFQKDNEIAFKDPQNPSVRFSARFIPN